MKQFYEDAITKAMKVLLMIGLGVVIGLMMLTFQIGGSWNYRIESVKKSISMMSRPTIINKVIVIKDMPDHTHTGMFGSVKRGSVK